MTDEPEGPPPDAAVIAQMVCEEGLFTFFAAVGIRLEGGVGVLPNDRRGAIAHVTSGVGAARLDVPFTRELSRHLRLLADRLEAVGEPGGHLIASIPLTAPPAKGSAS